MDGPFAPRTNRFIGRRALLAEIEQAIAARESQSHVFFLIGSGGAGKTRLLEEVDRIVTERLPEGLLGSGVIDLYHSDTHTLDGLRGAIMHGLDPDRRRFPRYRALSRRYLAKMEAGLDGQTLENARRELNNAFLVEYAALAEEKRLVLCFDTLEELLPDTSIVQDVCRIQGVDTAATCWLQTYAPQFANTVILFAGRPMPRLTDVFQQQLATSGVSLTMREISCLTPEETGAFLSALCENEERGDDLAGILTSGSGPGFGRDMQEQIHLLSGGRPVYITLIADLLLTGMPLNELLPAGSAQATPDAGEIGRILVERMLDLEAPLGLAVAYLVYARRGLDRGLLLHLARGHWSEEEVDSLLEQLCRFAFVKSRPAPDGTPQLFLHDEVYDIFDLHFLDHRETGTSAEIVSYYRGQRRALEASDSWTRRQRDVLKAGLLYYEMQLDIYHGYTECYVPWAEDAIRHHDVALDMRLRDELLRFLARYVEPHSRFYNEHVASRIDKATVDRDASVRWVKRYIARGEYEAAYHTAKHIRTSVNEAFNPERVGDPVFRAALLIVEGEATILLGRADADTEAGFKEAIHLLEEQPRQTVFRRRRARILGDARNQLGDLYRTRGSLGLALEQYKHALSNFRLSAAPGERANTLTNMAYLQALLGRADQAEANIEVALALRRRLNLTYPLAVSMNTLGMIYTLQNQPLWGARQCMQARDVCREIGERRGEGMALIGLGIAFRKQGEQWQQGHRAVSEAAALFQRAQEALGEAVRLFEQEVPEPVQLWQALGELGNLFCEWAWMEQQQERLQEAIARLSGAIRFQGMALGIAKSKALAFQFTATCGDLASVYGDRSFLMLKAGKSKQAEQNRRIAEHYLDQVFEKAPNTFRLIPQEGFAEAEASGNSYWQALANAHRRRAIWQFRDLENGVANSRTSRTRTLEEGAQQFIMSIIYSEKYSPTSPELHGQMKRFFHFLRLNRVSPKWARMQIRYASKRYQVPLDRLEEAVGDYLGY